MMINGYRKTEIRSRRVVKIILIPLIGVLILLVILRFMGGVEGVTVLPVKEVQIYGNSYINSTELLKMMKVESNRSLLFFNKRSAKLRLLGDKRISGAELLKVWPHTLKVYVAEKEQKYQLAGAGERYWLSLDGIVLSQMEAGEEERMPFITFQANNDDIRIGEEIPSFLIRDILASLRGIEKAYPEFYRRIHSFSVGPRGVETFFKDKRYRVYLGNSVSEDKLSKMRALLLVLEKGDSSMNDIREIDLSVSYAAVQKGEK
jgi:hypothetical protein